MRKGKSESFRPINDYNKQEQHTSDREPMLWLRKGMRVNILWCTIIVILKKTIM